MNRNRKEIGYGMMIQVILVESLQWWATCFVWSNWRNKDIKFCNVHMMYAWGLGFTRVTLWYWRTDSQWAWMSVCLSRWFIDGLFNLLYFCFMRLSPLHLKLPWIWWGITLSSSTRPQSQGQKQTRITSLSLFHNLLNSLAIYLGIILNKCYFISDSSSIFYIGKYVAILQILK